jgi:quercetin dioxygenase-like cupin family protein
VFQPAPDSASGAVDAEELAVGLGVDAGGDHRDLGGPATLADLHRQRVASGGRPCYGEESTMSDEQVAPETKGVAVELLATVDLGPEIQGMEGRQLRMRMVTIEPGGVFGPVHDHKGRPGTVYVLQGTISDHRDGIATDYGPGVGWPEDRNTLHWLENRGTVPAIEISVDVVRHS